MKKQTYLKLRGLLAENDNPTVLARDLHGALDVGTPYKMIEREGETA